jgi:hypothetical protein
MGQWTGIEGAGRATSSTLAKSLVIMTAAQQADCSACFTARDK